MKKAIWMLLLLTVWMNRETAWAQEDKIIEFEAFFADEGSEINDDNEIMAIIAEKTGVKVKETWLTGQTAKEAVGTIIASGVYPDFINGVDVMAPLYDAGALIAWDDYIEKYPNIKEYYSDEEWDQFRQEDGHIYWMNGFQNIHGESRSTIHNDEAVWIQTRVLEWAGYPKIETYEQFFDLIKQYHEAVPETEDGLPNIPYTILCDDWKYFCLENAPQFLAGYPNDGSVLVDPVSLTVMDFNTGDTARRYFKKLNEEYHSGIVDPESFTQTYEEYIAKLCSGRVLGMIDQWWNFAYTVNDVFLQTGLDKKGCSYVPLGVTIDSGMENQWHASGETLNVSNGIAVTVDCEDPDAAFAFIDALLSQEIHDLRFWGVEGTDYNVDENGMYYRTEEQRMKISESGYKASHMCPYSYFPQWNGTSRDGINAMQPHEQLTEFQNGLSEDVKRCFAAYGVTDYVEMLGSTSRIGSWYPMYSYSNTMTAATPGGRAWIKMTELKHTWLPLVVMTEDFDGIWNAYVEAYSQCSSEDFLKEMQEELDRRMTLAKK